MAAPAAAAEPQASGGPRPPVCLLVLGMAGSGKTTFVQVRCMARAKQVCARGGGRPGKGGEGSPRSGRARRRVASGGPGETLHRSLGSARRLECIPGAAYHVVLRLSCRQNC